VNPRPHLHFPSLLPSLVLHHDPTALLYHARPVFSEEPHLPRSTIRQVPREGGVRLLQAIGVELQLKGSRCQSDGGGSDGREIGEINRTVRCPGLR